MNELRTATNKYTDSIAQAVLDVADQVKVERSKGVHTHGKAMLWTIRLLGRSAWDANQQGKGSSEDWFQDSSHGALELKSET